eukprot:365634-Chlamydomonas_euryale.AAC.10
MPRLKAAALSQSPARCTVRPKNSLADWWGCSSTVRVCPSRDTTVRVCPSRNTTCELQTSSSRNTTCDSQTNSSRSTTSSHRLACRATPHRVTDSLVTQHHVQVTAHFVSVHLACSNVCQCGLNTR